MMDDGRRQAREAARQRARDRTRRQRRVVAAAAIGVAAVAGLVVLTGTRDNPIGAGGAPAYRRVAAQAATAAAAGRRADAAAHPADRGLLRRAAGSPAGRAGNRNAARRPARLIEQAGRYERTDRPVQPAFELIATSSLRRRATDGDTGCARATR